VNTAAQSAAVFTAFPRAAGRLGPIVSPQELV
jgi:hypothetical protein